MTNTNTINQCILYILNLKKINRNNNCLTIPILQFIEKVSLNTQSKDVIKQLKYYLIYNIKSELSKYTQTIQTLNLSENINSKKLLGTLPSKDVITLQSPTLPLLDSISENSEHSIKHSEHSTKHSTKEGGHDSPQKVIKIIIEKEI